MAQRWLIERIDGARLLFSEKLGLDWGSPGGGWTPRKEEATRFDTEAAALDRVAGLGPMMSQMVRVAPHGFADPPAAPAPARDVSFLDLLARPFRPADLVAETPLEVAMAAAATPTVQQPGDRAPIVVAPQWRVEN
jgi:hypothetical protein